eukprot:4898429-Karenia_brevis.AAC.1
MHSSHAGANDRADFLMLATFPHSPPTILCSIYHTTNAPPQTFSGKVIIPESRLLAESSLPLWHMLDKAMHAIANSLALRRGLAIPINAQPAPEPRGLILQDAPGPALQGEDSDVSIPSTASYVPDFD